MRQGLIFILGISSVGLLMHGCSSSSSNRHVASEVILDSNGKPLGQEEIPPTEAAATEEILKLVKEGYGRYKPRDMEPSAHRIIHGKQHGCVHAEFKVRGDLPQKLRHGIFARPGASYPSWVRVSNGAGKRQHDNLPDGRGLAIKLMQVDGPKLADEAHTQDLLLQNAPNFFAQDVAAYVKFMKMAGRSVPAGVGELLRSISIRDPRDRRGIQILTQSGALIRNPLTSEYFSALPQKLGPYAMKLHAGPCPGHGGPAAGFTDRFKKDYLKEVMTEHLSKGDACIELSVQLQTDAVAMPIEDATVTWETSKSPFIPVAEIRIPSQSFSSEKREEFCENLSFNPWHSVQEHRPIGGLNRVRKLVYEHSSRFRHDLNQKTSTEPVPGERHE